MTGTQTVEWEIKTMVRKCPTVESQSPLVCHPPSTVTAKATLHVLAVNIKWCVLQVLKREVFILRIERYSPLESVFNMLPWEDWTLPAAYNGKILSLSSKVILLQDLKDYTQHCFSYLQNREVHPVYAVLISGGGTHELSVFLTMGEFLTNFEIKLLLLYLSFSFRS